MDVYTTVPLGVLHAVALRELAANAPAIEHLAVTPDLVAPLLQRLAGAER
jgi:hypothetical protein